MNGENEDEEVKEEGSVKKTEGERMRERERERER